MHWTVRRPRCSGFSGAATPPPTAGMHVGGVPPRSLVPSHTTSVETGDHSSRIPLSFYLRPSDTGWGNVLRTGKPALIDVDFPD